MIRLSENRISHLAHLVMDGLRKDKLAEFPNEGRSLAETKQVLQDFFQREDHIDEIVRQKIASLSRPVPAGQPGMGYSVPQIFRRGVPQATQIESRMNALPYKLEPQRNFRAKNLDIKKLMLRFIAA